MAEKKAPTVKFVMAIGKMSIASSCNVAWLIKDDGEAIKLDKKHFEATLRQYFDDNKE